MLYSSTLQSTHCICWWFHRGSWRHSPWLRGYSTRCRHGRHWSGHSHRSVRQSQPPGGLPPEEGCQWWSKACSHQEHHRLQRGGAWRQTSPGPPLCPVQISVLRVNIEDHKPGTLHIHVAGRSIKVHTMQRAGPEDKARCNLFYGFDFKLHVPHVKFWKLDPLLQYCTY